MATEKTGKNAELSMEEKLVKATVERHMQATEVFLD